jgi:autotransporter-associated beta strand protein/T5SS/PEP-CTERM-associated repeat protein
MRDDTLPPALPVLRRRQRLMMAGGVALAWAWLAFATPAMAQFATWTNPGSDDWTTAGNWDIGTPPTSTDTAVVDNGGTAIVSTSGQVVGELDLGLTGSGAVTIQGDGALAQSGDTSVASQIGTGSLTVTGAGSSFTTPGDLLIGRGTGSSTVTVEAGGQISTNRTFIGEGVAVTTAPAIAATVTGGGSLLNAGIFLGIGGGPGTTSDTLTISDGGTVMVDDPTATPTNSGGITTIGEGGIGAMVVTDNGSRLLLGGFTELSIGEFSGTNGNGTLTIENGGLVSTYMVIMGAFGTGTTGTLAIDSQGVLETANLTKDIGTATVSIDNGILQASADSTTFISGFDPGDITIQSGGATIDSHGFDVTATSALDGTGGLLKIGAGTLILDGVNGYTGATTVAAGMLVVGDSATPSAQVASDTTVDDAAALAGYGTIGGTLTADGTVIPGGPTTGIGVLHVSGDYSQNAGGTLSINVSPTVASQLAVGGGANLAGTVAFDYAAGTYHVGSFTILTGADGVSGRFGGLAESGAIPETLLRSVVYTPDAVDLVLSLPSEAAAGDTSIFADSSMTAQRNTLATMDLLLDPQIPDDKARCTTLHAACVWAEGIGHFGTFDGRGGAAGFSTDTGGFLAGIQQAVTPTTILGLGAGYEHTDLDAGADSGGIQTARLFAYGAIDLAPVRLSGTLGYAHDWFDSGRGNPGYLNTDIGTAEQSHDASEYGAGMQLALPTRYGALALEPEAGLEYAALEESGFAESGGGLLNLAGGSYDHNDLRSFVRLALSRPVVLGHTAYDPHLTLGYARELLPLGPTVLLSSAGDTGRAMSPFTARNIVTAGTRLDLFARGALSVSFRYDADIYVDDGLDQVLRLQAEWRL